LNISDLRDEIGAAGAKMAFDILVEGFSVPGTFTLHTHEQGFLNSLRILRGEDFCFAVIPNDEWVLAYIRKPELRRGRLDPEAVLAQFPAARMTNKGEITLRIRDAEMAGLWLDTIRAAG
jgi:hypothetical protein